MIDLTNDKSVNMIKLEAMDIQQHIIHQLSAMYNACTLYSNLLCSNLLASHGHECHMELTSGFSCAEYKSECDIIFV